MPSSSSTVRTSPIGWRAACGGTRRRPDPRLCLAVGLGVAAGDTPGPCATMSTACSRSCRSNRRRTGALAVRRASMSAIRWQSALPNCAPIRKKRKGARPIRRSSWCCRAAGRARSEDWRRFRRGDRRSRPARRTDRSGAADGAAPSGARARGRRRLAGEAAHRGRSGGKMDGLPFGRAALAASGTVTLELALAGVPLAAAYRLPLIEEIVARLAGLRKRLSSVILANLVIGENVVPEFLQRDCTPQKLSAALVALITIRRSASGRCKPSRGSTRS